MVHNLNISLIIISLLNLCASSSKLVSHDQIAFWSKNVHNKIPESMASKLSPLTTQASQHYSSKISSSQSFTATDPKFCASAGLLCYAKNHNSNSTQSLDSCNSYNSYQSYNFYDGYDGIICSLNLQVDRSIFFRASMLTQGNKINLPNLNETASRPAFLPSNIASEISLSEDAVKQTFPQASRAAIKATFRYCNAPAISREEKTCAKSLESLIDFAKGVLKADRLESQSLAKGVKSSAADKKLRIIKKVTDSKAPKLVACHEMFLPFATYFCHLVSDTRAYSVYLESETRGKGIQLFSVCHTNTKDFPENHVAFEILKIHPGEGEVCHWIDGVDLGWIAAT